MIQIICDNCERAFAVADDQAGGKAPCPHCGDVNRVPAPTGAAADITAPPAGDEPERVLIVVRQAMFRAHPFWYGLMVLLFLAGLVLAAAVPMDEQLGRHWTWIGLGGSAVALLWWLIWWAAPHRWVKLTITNKRTVRQEGIVMRKTSEVLHSHIRNIKIEQSIMNRLLGVGSISIDSAGGSELEPIEIRMFHVTDPYGIKSLIDQHRSL